VKRSEKGVLRPGLAVADRITTRSVQANCAFTASRGGSA